MKLYGMKMHNFMRFGESDNSIVFNVTKEQKEKIQRKELTFDEMYQSISEDPLNYIDSVNEIKDNVLDGIIGISGMTSGSFDSSNGSGKSTIFEAMAFLFYDKVVRQTINSDKKANAGLSVVTRLAGKFPKNLKESFVEAYFEEDGNIYRLKRGRAFTKTKKSSSPILEFDCIKDNEVDSLSGHRKKDTKRSLDQVIVEDYDIFVNTVMFGQSDAGKFLIGTDKTKKDMIIELLKLEDIVRGCIDIIRNNKKEENAKLNEFVARASSLKGLVLNIYRELGSDEVEYSDDLINIILSIINSDLVECKSNRKELVKSVDEINSNIKELENSDVIKRIKEITEEGKGLVKEKNAEEEKRDSEKKDWENILKGNEVDLQHINQEINTTLRDINENKSKLKKYNDIVESFDEESHTNEIDKCKKAESVSDKYKTTLEEIDVHREKAILKVSEFNTAIAIRKKDLTVLEKQIENAGDSNTFLCTECQSTVSKAHTVNKIKEMEAVIDESKCNLNKANERLEKLNEAKKSTKEKCDKIEQYRNKHQSLILEKKTFDDTKKYIQQVEEFVSQYQKTLSKREQEAKDSSEKIIVYKEKCVKIEEEFAEKIIELDKKIQDKRNEIVSLKGSASEVEKKINVCNNNKSNILLNIAELDKKCGCYQEKIDQVTGLNVQIVEEEKSVKEVYKQLQRLKILENAFGLEGVQTRIVAKYLPLLNMYVKQFLDILSNGKLIVNLLVNNKSKIDMEIIGGTANNYIMLSGGEKMVVRLAVDVGLSLLSFSRTSKTPDMICLDEIFGPLDPEHTKSVFLMLETLKDKFKRIFLISHKSEIQSLIKNNIIVEKSSGNMGLSKIVGVRDILT